MTARAPIPRGSHAAYIGGAEASAGPAAEVFDVLNPSTGLALAAVETSGAETVDAAVSDAQHAFRSRWPDHAPAERGRVLATIASRLRAERDRLALVEAEDAGIPMPLARVNVDVAARYFEFYAGAADKFGGATIPLGRGFVDFTVREPWGVCGIIVPFNSPWQQTARSVAAALAVGNTVVVKGSEQSPLVALELARLAVTCGLPPGALNVVHGHAATGRALVEHPAVAHVTFTGSRPVGTKVMESCARTIKPLKLELGGKSPQIVLDADRLEEAAGTIAKVMFCTAGQACSVGSRLLVYESLERRLAESVVRHAEAVTVGDARGQVDMGPVISAARRDAIAEMIERGRDDGGELLTGGDEARARLPGRGYFVPPTVFRQVDPEMRIAREEIFGPVMTITSVTSAEEALTIANDSEYGLVAGVWTSDVSTALQLAARLEVGQVFINNYGSGGGVELPFGGYKQSGLGREKGLEALAGYTQTKNVCIKT